MVVVVVGHGETGGSVGGDTSGGYCCRQKLVVAVWGVVFFEVMMLMGALL